MKILFCSQNPAIKELGASKILIELAEGLQELGWSCKIAPPTDIMPNRKHRKRFCYRLFAESLRNYLLRCAHEYDVVEYDHIYLPYPRAEFCPKTLFIARVVLLTNRLLDSSIPQAKSGRSRLHSLITGRFDKLYCQGIARYGRITLNEADLINVVNYDDKTELTKSGIPEEKIVVFHCGVSRSRRLIFDAVSSEVPKEPTVVFVGSLDNRKGAMDFPIIFENIHNKMPEVKFKLLGTGGNKKYVLSRFPRRLRNYLEVIPNFLSDDLPRLLAPCSIGVFPSYVEPFGFGVLEMLAASIPVVAYNTSGPAIMLSPEYLVSRGDVTGMSSNVVELLKDKVKLKAARVWAKEKSQQFSWPQIAQETSQVYLSHWQKRQTQESM